MSYHHPDYNEREPPGRGQGNRAPTAAPIVSAPAWRSGRSGPTSVNAASFGPGDGASRALINPLLPSTLAGARTTGRSSWTPSSRLTAPTVSSAGHARLSAPLPPARTSIPRDTNRTTVTSTTGHSSILEMPQERRYRTPASSAQAPAYDTRRIGTSGEEMSQLQDVGTQDYGMGSAGTYSPAPFCRPSPPSVSCRASPSSPSSTPWATPHDDDDVCRHHESPIMPIGPLHTVANPRSSTESAGRQPRSPSIYDVVQHGSSGNGSPFTRISRSPQIEEIARQMASPAASQGRLHDTTNLRSSATSAGHAGRLPRSPAVETLSQRSSPGRGAPLTRISRSPQIEEIARRMASSRPLDLQAGTADALTVSDDSVASFLAANPAFRHVGVHEERPTSGSTRPRTPATAVLAPVDQERHATHPDPRSHVRESARPAHSPNDDLRHQEALRSQLTQERDDYRRTLAPR
ncbi:hypothetical protein Hypma_004894 [Hypsizygus marmoreus]|uniref:Uncharacterized protein n=1 Tax=Hypsizygus marmoreus TaxID=39966 RepID=A0A369K8F7_HYPMA|nr:hypothetical protein Hypma_004894 [Hypsizygus marmoreus]